VGIKSHSSFSATMGRREGDLRGRTVQHTGGVRCSNIITDMQSRWHCGRCKLEGTIEQPCRDVLAHALEVCKGAHLYSEYLATHDDHDSWGMCTTSSDCKLLQ
jgi:hypothetical protein